MLGAERRRIAGQTVAGGKGHARWISCSRAVPRQFTGSRREPTPSEHHRPAPPPNGTPTAQRPEERNERGGEQPGTEDSPPLRGSFRSASGAPRALRGIASGNRGLPPADDDREHAMREMFHEELEKFSAAVVDMTNLVSAALDRATRALLDADVTLAESVISSEDEIDAAYDELEDKAVELLARQAPVAGDLRTIVAGLRGVADLERMGGLARHIAKITRLRYPACAVPDGLRGTVSEMSAAALTMAQKAAEVVASRDVQRARELEVDDDRVDALRRELFTN